MLPISRKDIENLRMLDGELTKNEDNLIQSRYKTGVFNFIGGISKILFGTLDNEDANYSDTINSLEKRTNAVFKAFKGTDNCCKVYTEVFKFYCVGSFR